MSEHLMIKAESIKDCDIISSLIQDSLLHVTHHSFHEEHNCLRFMLNRFCWEHVKDFEQHQCYYRVHSGLYIHDIKAIEVNKGFRESSHYLNLLTMHASEKEINLVFSEHKRVCIHIDKIHVYLKDLHAMHPTMSLPQHQVA